jgi:hypothetical protein
MMQSQISRHSAANTENLVVCGNSADGLRRLAVVELEHAAEPLTAAYWLLFT